MLQAMPELPEVEIHARNLRRWLEGRRIAACRVLDPLLAEGEEAGRIEAAAAGRRVVGVRRQAKYLLIELEGEVTLVAHLRMTGRFVHDSYAAGEPGHPTRMVLELDAGERVRFEDRRRFGRVWLAPNGDLAQLPELRDLGPDALLDPPSEERLRALAGATRRPVKTLLMDQRALGGLGNICALEILYRAGVAPERPANALTGEEAARIARLIPEYLEWAIAVQSRRELIYLGEKGAVNVFTVYRREGTPCPACGTPVVRTVLGGRGTYYCAGCQA
jgi:formamidopyrimidine-DNA glycosylase